MVLSFTPAAVAADPVEDPARDNGAAIAVEDVAAGAERDEAADGEDAQAGQEVPAGQDVPAEAPPAPAPQPADEPIRVIDLELLEQHSVRVPAYFHDVIQLGQWDGQGLNDIAMIEDNGDLMLYSHDAARSYMSPRRIGYGWKGFTHVMGGGDFNGDGQADILAVKADGKFFLYAGNGQGGFADSRQIGNGWTAFPFLLFLPAGPDITGMGHSTILIRNDAHSVSVYASQDGVAYSPAGTVIIPAGVESVLNAGLNEAGTNAFIDYVLADSRVVSIRLAAKPGVKPAPPAEPAPPVKPAPPVQPEKPKAPALWNGVAYQRNAVAGNGWPAQHVYSMGDFDGDGHHDAVIKRNDGSLVMYSYRNGTTFHHKRQIGNGWNGMRDIHTGVDFNGDRRTDIVARAQNGDLCLNPGNGKGGFSDSQRIGNGWTGFDQILVVQQGANGNPVIFARQGDMMRAYPTNGHAGFLAPQGAEGRLLVDECCSCQW